MKNLYIDYLHCAIHDCSNTRTTGICSPGLHIPKDREFQFACEFKKIFEIEIALSKLCTNYDESRVYEFLQQAGLKAKNVQEVSLNVMIKSVSETM